MSKSKTRTQANDILSGFAGTNEHDKIRAVRTFCNSDSAFVAWARKARFSLDAIRNARLLQQAWKRFGAARSILITLRAIKVALLKLSRGELLGRLTMAEANGLLKSADPKNPPQRLATTAAVGRIAQEELFA